MSQLIQLVYASKSRLPATSDQAGVEPGIARILTQSRRNNPAKSIGGVLCYGNGFFFQCLEGDRETVETLYARIQADDRHEDVRTLRKHEIGSRTFDLWAMKYLSLDRRVNAELKRLGLSRFEPFEFNEECIDRILLRLKEATEVHRQPAGNRREVGPAEPVEAEDPDKAPLLLLGAGALLFGLAAATMLAFGIF